MLNSRISSLKSSTDRCYKNCTESRSSVHRVHIKKANKTRWSNVVTDLPVWPKRSNSQYGVHGEVIYCDDQVVMQTVIPEAAPLLYYCRSNYSSHCSHFLLSQRYVILCHFSQSLLFYSLACNIPYL